MGRDEIPATVARIVALRAELENLWPRVKEELAKVERCFNEKDGDIAQVKYDIYLADTTTAGIASCLSTYGTMLTPRMIRNGEKDRGPWESFVAGLQTASLNRFVAVHSDDYPGMLNYFDLTEEMRIILGRHEKELWKERGEVTP
jgi:hypothetical protein